MSATEVITPAIQLGTATRVALPDSILDRMVLAVELVKQRLKRVAAALHAAAIPYAVIGGNAVAAWVATIDARAVRTTADVDLAIRRADLDRAIAALEPHGFVYRHAAGVDFFLDGPGGTFGDAVHLVFCGEKVCRDYAVTVPDVSESVKMDDQIVLNLEAILRMKLTSFRRKDQVHVQDMIRIGLIDNTWLGRFASPLQERLQELLDDPDG